MQGILFFVFVPFIESSCLQCCSWLSSSVWGRHLPSPLFSLPSKLFTIEFHALSFTSAHFLTPMSPVSFPPIFLPACLLPNPASLWAGVRELCRFGESSHLLTSSRLSPGGSISVVWTTFGQSSYLQRFLERFQETVTEWSWMPNKEWLMGQFHSAILSDGNWFSGPTALFMYWWTLAIFEL